MRLDVSAVQHDMKREETVEEVEKNTEWQRRTPKAGVGGSNPFWRATSEQAVYHLLRLFMEKSARAHAAAPPFGGRECCGVCDLRKRGVKNKTIRMEAPRQNNRRKPVFKACGGFAPLGDWVGLLVFVGVIGPCRKGRLPVCLFRRPAPWQSAPAPETPWPAR